MSSLLYKRVVLKISGEMFCESPAFGVQAEALSRIAGELKKLSQCQVQMAVVVGGGNIFRGRQDMKNTIGRASADYMGMLATCVNALALQEALEKQGVSVRVQTALRISAVAEPYVRRRALRHLGKNRVVIFAGGTGHPFFTTDTAAALRAIEMEADVLLKATQVDGVYDKDPHIHKNSQKYSELSYIEMLNKKIKVIDSTAISLCMDNNMPVIIFNSRWPGIMERLVKGEKLGTVIH